jgi:2-polyprenyl-6-methoxyphenol hydroxylase-like FAD-dependent oxidoreductase
VDFGAEVTGVRQTPDEVTAKFPDGTAVRAAYLVAADGGRSAVRRALGIGMTGETVDPKPMLVADVRLDGIDRQNIHAWVNAEGGGLILQPLAGTDDFQLIATYEDAGAQPDTSAEGVRKVIANRTHLSADDVREVRWASDFRPRAALADRFRDGRVFVAGDAAHVHSPVGAQGLNTSVQDAYNLGWKLGQVLRHSADDTLLSTYEEERLPIAADVLGLSTRLHRSYGGDQPAQRRGAETQQLGLGYRGGPLSVETRTGQALAADDLTAGDRAPDAPLASGRRLFDLFRGPHFTLLGFGGGPVPDGLPDWVHAHAVSDPLAREAYGDGLFLIRPDGYVGLATADGAGVRPYLERFQG